MGMDGITTVNDHPMLNKVAWFPTIRLTQPIRVFFASCKNGLYDIFGNVQEWVWDVSDSYPPSTLQKPIVDPIGPEHGNHHVFRGGAWNRYAENLSPTIRKDAAFTFLEIMIWVWGW